MFPTNLVRYMRIKEKTTKDFTQNSDPTLNIPRSTFYYILKGENTPSPENARKIAKVLGIEAETLFKHDDKEREEEEFEAERKEVLEFLDRMISYHEKRRFWRNVKIVVASVLGFIALTAYFLMLSVALQS